MCLCLCVYLLVVSDSGKLLPRAMQDATSSVHGGPTVIPPTKLMSQAQQNGVAGYASLYPHVSRPRPSLSVAPYEALDSDSDTSSENSHLLHSLLVQDRQEMINRHTLCLTRLRQASEEANSLRRENTHLRTVNRELNKHLSHVIQATVQKQMGSTSATSDYAGLLRTLNRFRGMSIGDKGAESRRGRAWDEERSEESPTSAVDSGRVENVEVGRSSLPKSISVRSNGYLKIGAQGVASNGGRARSTTRSRPGIPLKVAVNLKFTPPYFFYDNNAID